LFADLPVEWRQHIAADYAIGSAIATKAGRRSYLSLKFFCFG